MGGIKVSVIIATYNRAETLIRTVKSICRQTEKRIEILVCDDGSTDETRARIEALQKEDPRIVYIDCGHNGRPAIPRNIGIRNAKGKWLAFCDDDDIWNPVKLEVQLHELEGTGLKACCTNAFFYEGTKNTGKKYFDTEEDKVYRFRDLIDVNPVICSSMIWHSSLMNRCKGFAEPEALKAIEDYALWWRIACYTGILYIRHPLTGYLITSHTSIRNHEEITFEEQRARVKADFMEWLNGQPERVKRYHTGELIGYHKDRGVSKLRGSARDTLGLAKRIVKRLLRYG